MPLKISSFPRLMKCQYLILYFFCFHTGKVIVGGEFIFCGYLQGNINTYHHDIGPGPCSLKVSINPAGLEIKAHLIENGLSICTEDVAATRSNALSEICITWKERVDQLVITRGDVVKSYSTAMATGAKCCQNFILTNSISSNDSSLLNDIIYINGTDFSPVHIKNASYLQFTGSERACESLFSDCTNQKEKLTQLAGKGPLKQNDARYAILLTDRILEECNESISVGLESELSKVMMETDFSKDCETFVTPNVKAAVIKVGFQSNTEFAVTANFSWMGPDGQMMFAAVQFQLEYRLSPSLLPRAVLTQFKQKTSLQWELCPVPGLHCDNRGWEDLTAFGSSSRAQTVQTVLRIVVSDPHDRGQEGLGGCAVCGFHILQSSIKGFADYLILGDSRTSRREWPEKNSGLTSVDLTMNTRDPIRKSILERMDLSGLDQLYPHGAPSARLLTMLCSLESFIVFIRSLDKASSLLSALLIAHLD
ncbi:uncharacterized protein LOC121280036 [Carcharodon carcharias]|uniref:uncharacterized protein LOC121280036 n=1 Tax=Carcharodon carcharias TaxID=13397 RepID=UPI001B7E51CC|nr:uncharacterized protein LOC121280036 [Carcharodon carcharias]